MNITSKTAEVQPLTRGILYTQRDGFTEFEAPVPPRAPGEPFEKGPGTMRHGWMPIAPCAWFTGDAAYPVVAANNVDPPQVEVWFRSFADYVAYALIIRAPNTRLDEIACQLERIRHGQHESAGDEGRCAVCEHRASEAVMYIDHTAEVIGSFKRS